MAASAAVRDVGRVLDIPYNKVDRIAKMIPRSKKLKEALEKNDRLKNMYQDDQKIHKMIDYALGIEGMPRHISTHAAGVIIGPDKLTNYVPLQFQDDNIITQLPMEELEDLGLLKMDFLGLRNLTIIDKTIALVEERFGETIKIEEIPLDDDGVYQMLGQGNTLGVFQMESYLFQDLNRRLKPEEFEDLIALLALGRPGPLGSGLVDDYIKSRHGEKEPEYLHPRLEPILKETYGMILYQEQVMQIASDLGNFSMGEADILRRGMGKKKEKLVARERQRFVNGALENGISEKIANKIFDQMEYFSGYGFNKSHSAAYALLAYQTAYLKVNYPAEFMAALLSTVMNNLDKVGQYIRECKEMGLKVLPPDINESGYQFKTTAKGEIRFGLKAIKHVGKSAIKSIITNRKNEKYTSLLDFLKKVDTGKVNIKTLESLIKAGAMDSLDIHRSQMLIKFEEIYDRVSSQKKGHKKGQTSFFDLVSDEADFYQKQIEYPDIEELDINDKLNQEKKYLGIYVSGHPLDIYSEKIKKMTNINCDQLTKIQDKDENLDKNINNQFSVAGIVVNNKEHITKRNNKMAFITIEDWSGNLEIVVFPDLYNDLSFSAKNGTAVMVVGYLDDDSFIAKNMLPLNSDFVEINLNSITENKYEKLQKILSENTGELPVVFLINNLRVIAGRKYWLEKNSNMETRIQKIVGEEMFQYYN